jgi:hypothetical protein
MSHHLDSPLARQNVRLDSTDLYVFRGEMGTVFVLNINNSISRPTEPQGFHAEAQYAFRLDLDGDAVEDLTYRLTFGERDDIGRQTVELRRLSGRDAHTPTAPGTAIAAGVTGETMAGVGGLRVWAGRAADPFAIDPTVLNAVGAAFKNGTRVDLTGWQADMATNRFAGTTVNAIVLEVPDAELSWRLREAPGEAPGGAFTWRLQPDKRINVWATTLLANDAGGWQPINRAGHPMIQPIFHPDDTEEASRYNTTAPADDLATYGERFARMVAAVVAAHGTAADPQAYGETVAALLLPDMMLPYQLGSPACYGFAGHNGRALTDNAPEVMYSLVTNMALSGGLSRVSGSAAVRDAFPYVAAVPAE